MKNKEELKVIPGIGKKISAKLNAIGVFEVSDLKGKDPEKLYAKLQIVKGSHVDRCVLYLFRCAVYYAENEENDKELLKWWNWKDR